MEAVSHHWVRQRISCALKVMSASGHRRDIVEKAIIEAVLGEMRPKGALFRGLDRRAQKIKMRRCGGSSKLGRFYGILPFEFRIKQE